MGDATVGAHTALGRLLELMERLRDPHSGCPWDREQTFATVAPYTIEEAYEVADAIARGDRAGLRDELGDLLFQVIFHTRLAQERGWFDFEAVAQAIHAKLVRRHPHVFGGAATESASEHSSSWEHHKARERAESAKLSGRGAAGVLEDVPKALPALSRAAKLGRRASRVGFDWTNLAEVRAKIAEELGELDEAICRAERPRQETPGKARGKDVASDAVAEEFGDTLFALVNLSRHLDLDPEEALRAANAKFERRFRHMEVLARARQRELTALSAAEWDALWRESKHATTASSGPADVAAEP